MIIDWYTTNKCNLKCSYCYATSINESSKKNSINLHEIALKLIEVAKKYPIYIFILGGEPFINREMLDILKLLSKSMVINEIFTNGTFLGDTIIESIEELNIKRLNISIDSNIYQIDSLTRINTRKEEFERILNFIKIISDLKKRKSLDLELVITPVISNSNKNHIIELYEFCYQNQIGIEFQSLYQRGRAINNDWLLNIKDELDILIEIGKIAIIKKIPLLQISDTSLMLIKYINKVLRCKVYSEWDSRCQLFKDDDIIPYISINWDGDIYACIKENRNYTFGNINDDSLLNIIEQRKDDIKNYTNMLQKDMKNELLNICKECYFYKSLLCSPCPLPNKASLNELRCEEVKKRDMEIYEHGY